MIDLKVDFESKDIIKRRMRDRGIKFVEIEKEIGVSNVEV